MNESNLGFISICVFLLLAYISYYLGYFWKSEKLKEADER